MQDKSSPPPSFIKMEQARRLLDQGNYQESLVVALEALLEELDHLRNSLLALSTVTRPGSPRRSPGLPEEPPQPDHFWLPAPKPRVLH